MFMTICAVMMSNVYRGNQVTYAWIYDYDDL